MSEWKEIDDEAKSGKDVLVTDGVRVAVCRYTKSPVLPWSLSISHGSFRGHPCWTGTAFTHYMPISGLPEPANNK